MARGNGASNKKIDLLVGVTVGVIALLVLSSFFSDQWPEVLRAAMVCAAVAGIAVWGVTLSAVLRTREQQRLERERLIAHYLAATQASELARHTAHDQSPEDNPTTLPYAETPEAAAPKVKTPKPGQPTSIVPSQPPTKPIASASRRAKRPEPERSRFSFSAFAAGLSGLPDALQYLKLFVGDVRTRQADTSQPPVAPVPTEAQSPRDLIAEWIRTNYTTPADDKHSTPLPPCDEELWLARQLEDAGLFSPEEMPLVQAIRPRHSHMVYLRPLTSSMTWTAMLRLIEIEAALNRARLASSFFNEPHAASTSELLQFSQRFDSSVCGQWHEVVDIALNGAESANGEWEFREAFSTAVETMQLPYRLTCTFRSNLERGAVAIEVEFTPPEVFPKQVWSAALGREVPTNPHLRENAAATYGARVALLLAAVAFGCSRDVRTVSVAGRSNTGSAHQCLYSVEFDRLRFMTVNLSDVPDPLGTLRAFGATVDEQGGELAPVIQSFNLEDELFCPKERYAEPSLRKLSLTAAQASALGCSTTADLEINEDVLRRLAASELMRQLGGTVSDKVAVILSLTKEEDANIAEAGMRTAAKLISGELDDENPLEVEDEFVNGDEMTRAVEHSLPLLERGDFGTVAQLLTSVLARADDYTDRPGVSYRYFNNYIERVMYNRAFAEEGARVELVPDAFFNAHLILASALYETGDFAGSLAHAERAHELDPLDDRAVLRMVRCHEKNGDIDRAIDLLNALLRHAHTNESLGVAYYRMAFMQHLAGNDACSEACYRKSVAHPSSCTASALMEMLSLHGPESLETEETDLPGELETGGVTVAPTLFVSHVLADAARAAVDAEVFPVARNLAQAYGALEGNDVLFGVIRSIEHEPDR